MPAAKKLNKKSKKAAAPAKKKGKKSFKSYIAKVLKQTSKSKLSLSNKSMSIIEGFVNDQLSNILTEASALTRANKKQTLGSREIQTAVRLILPAGLGNHCMSEATKAVAKLSA